MELLPCNLCLGALSNFEFVECHNCVVELVLGTAQLARPYGIVRTYSHSADDPAVVLKSAEAFGFGAVDTAPVYGEAERIIGDAKIGMAVHTKLDPEMDEIKSIRRSCLRLGVQKIDIVYQHKPFHGSKVQIRAFERARDELPGVVGSLGVSVYSLAEFRKAMEVDIIEAIQIPVNVALKNLPEDVYAEAKSAGKAIFARSVLLQGVLLNEPTKLPGIISGLSPFVREFQRLAAEWEMTPIQAAINFVKSKSWVSGAIVGANTVKSLVEIRDAFSAEPDEDFVEACKNLTEPSTFLTDPRNWST